MAQIVMDDVATIAPTTHACDVGSIHHRSSHEELRYENLFVEGGEYVFDGNRVVAHWRIGSNDVGRWRLYTINPDLSLVITPDLRIRKYRRNGRTCCVHVVRSLETVFDALRPLGEAMSKCARHGHLWSLARKASACPTDRYTWTWCLTCGAEHVSFPETAESLEWSDAAAEIAARTGGALPTLHGPIVGGTSCNR